MFSYKGDTVLDPFNGLGTSCVVAKDLERNFIGFDLSQQYCDKATLRISGGNIVA